MRRTPLVSSLVVASLVVLVGCSSGGTPTASSSAASSSSSSASESSSSSSTSSASGSGSSTVQVDAETAAWFETFCGGLAPFGELASGNVNAETPEELGTLLGTIGQAFTDTGAELETLPPPTFSGGAELATTLQTNMKEGGQIMLDFADRAATLSPTDQAGGQQFVTDFQNAIGSLDIAKFEPTAEAKAAANAVPACQELGLGS